MFAFVSRNTKREKQRDRQRRDNRSTVSFTQMDPLLHRCPERNWREVRGHSELYLQIIESMPLAMFK